MRKTCKRLLSLVLALVIMAGFAIGLNINTFAAQDPQQESTDTSVTEAYEETETTETETEATEFETIEGTEEETQDTTMISTEDDTQPPTEPTNIKVGAVGKLYKDSGSTTEIVFHWEPVEDVDGYYIYYKNNDTDKEYKHLTTTTSTKITVKNLKHTTPYQFKVSAFVERFGKTYEGKAQIGKTATQPAATNKPSLKRSSTLIEISWNRNSRASGYCIYRQDAKTNGKLVLYKTIKNNSTTKFTDKKVSKNRAYNYQVRAFREMYPNKRFYGTGKTLRTVAGLCAPGVSSCTSQVSRVSFVWKKNACAQGYDIYYSTKQNGPFTLLKTTKATYLNTPRLKNNTKYYFRIKPYKYVGDAKHKVHGTYTPFSKTVTNKAYGKNIGKTYIEISIKQQRMWFYINEKLYVETPVVTGNYYGYSTPKGAYSVFQRSSPATLVGPTWCVNVTYWLAFTRSGCGIHDSTWRSSSEYGGNTYIGNGSHGCVNTPYSKVKQIYSKAKIGTPVVVY